jgi:hypothetical protein
MGYSIKEAVYLFIKSRFEKEGYELLSREYVNSKTKLKYRCSEGHEHSIRWDSWQQGQRCFLCSKRRASAKKRVPLKFIKSEFAKKGYKLLTTGYKNAHQKLKYICSKNHEHSVTWNDWQQGIRCPYCAGNGKPAVEFIRSEFENEGYELLSERYVNAHQKLDYICPKGHRHSISWNSFKFGERCPYCVGIMSKGEIQVRNFVESLGIKVSSNDRGQIFNPNTGNGLELDIFMTDFNKAVEYNSEYWHRDKSRDLLKQQLCKSKGIDLLTIWDKKWKTSSEKCKSKIVKFIFD